MKNNLLLGVALLLCACFCVPNSMAQATATTVVRPSIFEEFYQPNTVLDISLQSDWKQLIRTKHTSEKQEAKISYRNRNGQTVTRSITLNSRGKSRREICSFPPLKLHFDKEELAAEGFIAHFNDVKLVTHCHPTSRSEQQVLKEYLAYLLYNQISPVSYRVQLVRIHYLQEDGKLETEQTGFLIEDTDALAYRLQGKQSERSGLDGKALDAKAYSQLLLFQYMIGNTDWDLATLHNIKIIKRFSNEALLPVAYDFDYSGLVDAFYAIPNERVQQVSLKQRVLMGKFPNQPIMEQTIQQFIAAKAAIFSTCETFTLLDANHRRDVLEYLREFYHYIEHPKVASRGL